MKKISMDDIAKKLGVSKTTVSRAFKDSSDISNTLKTKILETATEMGYRYNNSAGSLRTSVKSNVGVIANKLFTLEGETFYNKIYHHIVSILSTHNYNCLLEIYENDELPLFLSSDKVDGVIILGQLPESFHNKLLEYKIPFVLIDDQNENVNSVFTDNFQSSFKLTNYLIESGHTSIGFVGNTNASKSILERFFGFTMSLEYANLKLDPKYIISDRDNDNNEIDIVLPKKLPSAFFCNNDKTAFDLVNILKAHGFNVPDDISVVGFDDTIYAKLCQPNLTTAKVNTDLLAQEGVRLLFQLIEGNGTTISNLSLSTSILKRQSVKNIKNS